MERPLALAVTPTSIAITDMLAGRVHRFSWDGRLVASAGRKGEGPGELEAPMSIRLGPDESLWTSDIRTNRITHYSADGGLLATFPSPGGYELLPLADGGVLVPSPSGPLFAVVRTDGSFESISDVGSYPDELSGLQGAERVGLRQLLMSRRDDGSVFLVHNVPDFSTWSLSVDIGDRRLVSATRTELPEWFEIEARKRITRMQKDFEKDGLLLVPFSAIHAPSPGGVWLTTGPLGSMIGAQLPIDSDGMSIAVMATNGEKRGLMDAVMVGNRLVALYDTSVRIYSLKEVATTEW